jgi:hypothetical protein
LIIRLAPHLLLYLITVHCVQYTAWTTPLYGVDHTAYLPQTTAPDPGSILVAPFSLHFFQFFPNRLPYPPPYSSSYPFPYSSPLPSSLHFFLPFSLLYSPTLLPTLLPTLFPNLLPYPPPYTFPTLFTTLLLYPPPCTSSYPFPYLLPTLLYCIPSSVTSLALLRILLPTFSLPSSWPSSVPSSDHSSLLSHIYHPHSSSFRPIRICLFVFIFLLYIFPTSHLSPNASRSNFLTIP